MLLLRMWDGIIMGIRTEDEIKDAIEKINDNDTLTYGYREDVTSVLTWVLGSEEFDGIDGE